MASEVAFDHGSVIYIYLSHLLWCILNSTGSATTFRGGLGFLFYDNNPPFFHRVGFLGLPQECTALSSQVVLLQSAQLISFCTSWCLFSPITWVPYNFVICLGCEYINHFCCVLGHSYSLRFIVPCNTSSGGWIVVSYISILFSARMWYPRKSSITEA